jgi:hypothetical protein
MDKLNQDFLEFIGFLEEESVEYLLIGCIRSAQKQNRPGGAGKAVKHAFIPSRRFTRSSRVFENPRKNSLPREPWGVID